MLQGGSGNGMNIQEKFLINHNNAKPIEDCFLNRAAFCRSGVLVVLGLDSSITYFHPVLKWSAQSVETQYGVLEDKGSSV